MDKQAKEIFSDQRVANKAQNDRWVVMEGYEDIFESSSMESSQDNSIDSIESSSSSELVEDASSKSCSSSSSSSFSSSSALSNGPLYELSELMVHLPIRRGLSKFYQGKSQSFTSLASVTNLEDLPKKFAPYRKKMKLCKSYGGGLEYGNKLHFPKAAISKKSSRGSFLSSLRQL
ncbi:hypothetical protein PanWU01x14_137940 [Parasponia andersonii]|uniref:Oxidative stress 3 n=1 Tax=Parasponia andersonii TaxID=3476 RepID=A0A2P5CN51_PARAD|nr:hypothetical protein PanWU01x14_137940 [Parasponia andersonii]